MKNDEFKIYNSELGVDATIPELRDWYYRDI